MRIGNRMKESPPTESSKVNIQLYRYFTKLICWNNCVNVKIQMFTSANMIIGNLNYFCSRIISSLKCPSLFDCKTTFGWDCVGEFWKACLQRLVREETNIHCCVELLSDVNCRVITNILWASGCITISHRNFVGDGIIRQLIYFF